MPQPVSIVRDVPPIELTECLKWLLNSVSPQRAQWIVSQLTDCVSRQKTSDIYAVELRHGEQIQGAAIAILQPPSAATLLAIHQSEGISGDSAPDRIVGLAAIMDRLQSRLRTAGLRFLQVSADDREPGPKFEQLGFYWIADLVFLVLDSEQWSDITLPDSTNSYVFSVVGDDSRLREIACRIACESFAETKDCPRLSEFRSPAEIVTGYTASATFDPTLWRVLFLEGEPVGCLFLTAHGPIDDVHAEPAGTPCGMLELSYMGVVPKHRGNGLGRRLLTEAASVGRHRNVERMVLAVDRQNSPAISLYQRYGWVQAAGESVWGMNVFP